MTLDNDRKRLETIEEKRSALVDAMAKISNRFVVQFADELPHRWEQIVRQFVTNRPDEAKAQGHEGLTQLKSELREMQARAQDVAKQQLRGPTVWRHEKPELVGASRTGVQSPPPGADPGPSARVTGPIRHAEAEVLNLLYPVFGNGNGPWHKAEGGSLSLPLEEMIAAYQTLSLQLEDVEAEQTTLTKRIAAAEAEQLWDSA